MTWRAAGELEGTRETDISRPSKKPRALHSPRVGPTPSWRLQQDDYAHD
jgi:hypothetical protein